jgi:hypothetical protein
VPELALDHVERHALAGHLDGMCVAKLVRGEAAADARLLSFVLPMPSNDQPSFVMDPAQAARRL